MSLCKYGICNVWLCECIGFVKYGCVYVLVFSCVGVCVYGFCNVMVCVCMDFVMCGFLYVCVL